MEEDDIVQYPIGAELDLHTFRPREVGSLVPEYLREAANSGFRRVRIIHGKGIGTLRETVHQILRKNPLVSEFHLADQNEGGWGATIAILREKPD